MPARSQLGLLTMTPNNEQYPDLYIHPAAAKKVKNGCKYCGLTHIYENFWDKYVHESTIAPLEQRIKELEEELKTNKAIRAKLAIQSLCI